MVLDEFIVYLANVKNYSERTLPTYRSNLLQFFDKSKIDIVTKITPAKAERFIADRKAAGISQNTNATFMNSLRAFITFCNKRGYLRVDLELFEMPKRNRTRIEMVTGEEVNRMVEACSRLRDKLILLMLYTSGVRVSELVQASVENVDGNRFTIIGKGNKPHVCYFDRTVAEQLQQYIQFEGINSGPIFRTTTGKAIHAPAITHIVRKAAKIAKISKHVHPHMFRHGFATSMLENGADVRTVQESLGHEQIQTTMRYLHVTDDRLRESHDKYAPKVLTPASAYATMNSTLERLF